MVAEAADGGARSRAAVGQAGGWPAEACGHGTQSESRWTGRRQSRGSRQAHSEAALRPAERDSRRMRVPWLCWKRRFVAAGERRPAATSDLAAYAAKPGMRSLGGQPVARAHCSAVPSSAPGTHSGRNDYPPHPVPSIVQPTSSGGAHATEACLGARRRERASGDGQTASVTRPSGATEQYAPAVLVRTASRGLP